MNVLVTLKRKLKTTFMNEWVGFVGIKGVGEIKFSFFIPIVYQCILL